jgi:hypothetical protein
MQHVQPTALPFHFDPLDAFRVILVFHTQVQTAELDNSLHIEQGAAEVLQPLRESAIWLFVQGNVIRSFKLNHEIAFDLTLVIAPGFGVVEQGQAQFVARGAQGSDVFDLRFDSGEMTHLFRLRVEGYGLKKGGESHVEIAAPY